MAADGMDPGFVGAAYEAPVQLQDAETCINWFTEIAESRGAKMPIALLGCPGLDPLLQLAIGQGRGGWVLPGNTTALVVIGSALYLVSVSVPATQNSLPQFQGVQVGTLLTNAGRVTIRDNGPAFVANGQTNGGYAVIVDGQYGYYYWLQGTTQTVTVTAGVSMGNSAATVAVVPNLVAGSGVTFSDSSNFFAPGTQFLGANFNTPALNLSTPASGNNAADVLTFVIPPFGQIIDPAFLGATHIAFIEGWLIFNQPNSRTFYTNAATPYTVLFAGAFYDLKDSSTDNLVALYENNRELWLIGERTSEVWYNAGGTNFAFARIPAVGPQIGCSAGASLTRAGTALAWLARNEQGDNIVAMNEGYSYTRVSNHGVEHALSSYPVISDAFAYAYQEEGHLFYMLTFPTADVTWCLDLKTRMWHQRLSFDPNTGYHRHRSAFFLNLADTRLVGDYQSGQLHHMSREYFTDAGNPLRCQRRAPHIWANSSRQRVFHSSLQVEFQPGVGLQSGQGKCPQAMLRWSNDHGYTWSNEYWRDIGQVGQTRRRAIWRRLGASRVRTYELNYAENTVRDIIGATLFAEGEHASEGEAA